MQGSGEVEQEVVPIPKVRAPDTQSAQNISDIYQRATLTFKAPKYLNEMPPGPGRWRPHLTSPHPQVATKPILKPARRQEEDSAYHSFDKARCKP